LCVESYALRLEVTPAASFVALQGNNIIIDTQDPLKIGDYVVDIYADPQPFNWLE
jgi:hypothetical protein